MDHALVRNDVVLSDGEIDVAVVHEHRWLALAPLARGLSENSHHDVVVASAHVVDRIRLAMPFALGLRTDRRHRALPDEERLDLLREHRGDRLEVAFLIVVPAIAQPQAAKEFALSTGG